MKAPLTSSVFLAVVSAVTVCLASANPFELNEKEIEPNSPCTVRVWVRAEDLSPNHVSGGELRIKVLEQECANQVASVVLRLQLDEFGEFKHLKEGAVWPKEPSSNENAFGSTKHSDAMESAIQAHDDGLNDPKLWTIKAEERRAWTTEAILLQDPDLSEPIIAPFTVAVPAVNYPAVVQTYRGGAGAGLPVGQHSFSALSYRYIAIVTFTDGHTENIPAGYTAFIQSSKTDASRSATFTRNVTFETTCTDDNPRKKGQEQRIEKCLPKEQRSVFVAEVTLQSGETAQGQTLKGRITIHTLKDGATTLSDIHVAVDMVSRDRWAEAQTGTDGDSACSMIQLWPAQTQLWSESNYYSSIFPGSSDDHSSRGFADIGASRDLTSSDPHFSFEIEIPRETPMDFVSYYSSVENRLQLRLTGLLPVDVVRCMHPDEGLELLEKEEEADAATTEERLWEMWTPIVEEPAISASSIEYYRTSIMEATLPITIVSSGPSQQAIAHYLSPSGAVSPVLRSGLLMDVPASFPSAKPVFVVEDIANTSARLMQSRFLEWERRVSSMPDYPDPSKNYREGNYVAVLWKKKVVAEEMGIWPPREGKVLDKGDGQRPLTVSP